MKKLFSLALLAALASLFVGYYEALEDADISKVFFIKQEPTLQIRFRNLYANDSDDKPFARLSAEDRDEVIAYCRYRLGIHTELKTPQELEACKKR